MCGLRLVHTRRQVAATCRGDTLQRQIASCVVENFVKILVAATEFCRSNKSHRFSLIWFFATCCSNKILSRRQRFSQKFSSTHEAICRCGDVLPHLVAATSHPTCTHGVICYRDVLLQLVAWCVPTFIHGMKKWFCTNLPLANMSQKCKYWAKVVNATFVYQKTWVVNNDKEANVAFTMFAPDLLLSCHKFAAYLPRAN